MWTLARFVTLAVVITTAGCTPTYRNHGYIPPEEELQKLAVGVDTRATVESSVGPPTAGGVLSGGDFYYVRSRTKTVGMRETREINRQVLAISFDSRGVVRNIERFGLKNGRVVPLTRRVTASGVSDTSLLRQLTGNIGRVSPSM
ncbi:MAG: outer membrane protein assembly factor BamE [Tateyamaria sp.]|mgnify:CR=1 FL=1|jgi:outer membrane protein assembly factor BamE (lipoprotein component of BamABCDE complex)|nr:outer membrane protein assembly factor BamE [Tateyamaria sp.]MCH9833123.1 outer membrane protein assembly factor BamE [Alphaproteobacteria bacterium]HAB38862.1 outer membrane protein assembly factor BamE [Paracoccaceae bacterium]MBT5301698.1 outer membrane protein assembly factor BamE [Tateyamaria sp.]MBT6267221.1 outer membrane protein assembly factor BamE [Tateyamaria sp.]